MRRAATRCAALLLAAGPARAHDGPPYPILVDREAGPLLVSVWADPDVGVGTFYFYLEPRDGDPLPETAIELFVRPSAGGREEARFVARPADEGEPYQQIAEVEFDTRERWDTRCVLSTPRGGGELSTAVEVTPPGLGPFDLVWYLTPFVALAFLWGKALLTRRAYHARLAASEGEPSSDPAASEPS